MFKGNYIYIAPSERKTSIYHFTKIKWIVDSIVQKKNTLVSPRKWDDPFENALAREIRLRRPNGALCPHPFRNRVYGQCWTLNQETDAFWRMYVPEGDGVVLRSTIGALYRSLERSQVSHTTSCFIGRVQYKSGTEIEALFNAEFAVNAATHRWLYYIGALANLKELFLLGVLVADDAVMHLSKLTNLRYLSINKSQLSQIASNKLHEALPNCEIHLYL